MDNVSVVPISWLLCKILILTYENVVELVKKVHKNYQSQTIKLGTENEGYSFTK